MNSNNHHLVYSTNGGRIVTPEMKPAQAKGDGIVRIQQQTRGRKGKGVSIITGVEGSDEMLGQLAAELKKKCGCGGAVKEDVIEIQGDQRIFLKQLLEEKGMKVKLVGG